jgi:hypothetical protein
MTTFSRKTLLPLLAAASLALIARPAAAAPTITLLGDSGTLRVTTYSPLQIVSPNVGPIYGTSPLPTITTSAQPVLTWKITFNPSSQFIAAANNAAGGKTSELNGALSFIFTADSPFILTSAVALEDGIWNTTGNGTVDIKGGMIVTNLTTQTSAGTAFGATTFSPGGAWTLTNTVNGPLDAASASYKITLDNTLFAEALANPTGGGGGSALLAKKDFTIIITAAQVPEPASLTLLALGSLTLLSRRCSRA